MDILIATLGLKQGYSPIPYENKKKEILCHSRFSLEAVSRELRLGPKDHILVVATQDSLKLAQEAKDRMAPIPVRILTVDFSLSWETLFKLDQGLIELCPSQDARIHLDTSTGPRSFPSLFLTFMENLEMSGSWKLGHQFQGQQTRKEEDHNLIKMTISPFEVQRQVRDWTEAVRLVKETGDVRLFSTLIQKTIGEIMRAKRSETTTPPKEWVLLRTLGDQLGHISTALQLNALQKVQDHSRIIQALLQSPELELTPSKSPLPLDTDPSFQRVLFLLRPLLKNLISFWGGPDPIPPAKEGPSLPLHFQVIQWYLDHGRPDQASLMLSETLLTIGVVKTFGAEAWLQTEKRKTLRELFNKNQPHLNQGPNQQDRSMSPKVHPIVKTWNTISQFRNIIAHCDMNPTPAKIQKDHKKRLKSHLSTLQRIYSQTWPKELDPRNP
jgi:hypothetical protein